MARHSSALAGMAGKWFRDSRGRFAIKTTGGTSKSDASAAFDAMRSQRISVSAGITKLYASRKGKHTSSVKTWEPGAYGGQDALIASRYQRGKEGPWQPIPGKPGWSHRPQLREAGWEVVGHTPKPAGYTRAALNKAKLNLAGMKRRAN